MIIQNFTGQVALAPVAQPLSTAVTDGSKTVAPVSKADAAPGAPVASTPGIPREISADELQHAASVINQVMRQANSSLQFSVDTETNTPVVRLVDTNTGELIRQIPSEEALAISQSIDQALQRQGLLCKQVA